MFKEYKYHPLAGGHIRLLELVPAFEEAGLRCKVLHQALDKSCHYEALSYEWGSMDNPQTLVCDDEGSQLQITRNLEAALRRLRDAKTVRTLWVDAVCINQKDNNEKNVQIHLMPKIYSHALRVVAWVGREKESDNAVMGLEWYLKILEAETQESKEAIRKQFKQESSKSMRKKLDLADTVRAWFSLVRFVQRGWFGRVWIIQECALAKDIVIQYDEVEILWSAFTNGLEKLMHTQGASLNTNKSDRALRKGLTMLSIRSIVSGKDAYVHNSTVDSLEPITVFGNSMSRPITDGDLFYLVKAARSHQATNPRDRIYGLLGVAEDAEREAIKVDYNASVEDVYTSFARTIISRTGTLDILTEADGSSEILPSWVPDWSQSNTAHGLIQGPESELATNGKEHPIDKMVFSWSANGTHLHVNARIVDGIQALTPGFDPERNSKKSSDKEIGSSHEGNQLARSDGENIEKVKSSNQIAKLSQEFDALQAAGSVQQLKSSQKLVSVQAGESTQAPATTTTPDIFHAMEPGKTQDTARESGFSRDLASKVGNSFRAVRPWLAKDTVEEGIIDVDEKHSLRSHDIFAYPEKLQKDAEDNPLKLLNPSNALLIADGVWSGISSTASSLKHAVLQDTRTVRIDEKLEPTWEKLVRPDPTRYPNQTSWHAAYAETLHAGSTFPELGSPDWVHGLRTELVDIWREKLVEHPFIEHNAGESPAWMRRERQYPKVQLSERLRLRYYEQVPGGNKDVTIVSKISRQTHVQINKSIHWPMFIPIEQYQHEQRAKRATERIGLPSAMGTVVGKGVGIFKSAKGNTTNSSTIKVNGHDVTPIINGIKQIRKNKREKKEEEEKANAKDDVEEDEDELSLPALRRRPTDPVFRAADEYHAKRAISRMVGRHIERVAGNRQFCKTERGDMGWVPLGAKIGDRIAVLDGTKVPMVLRPVDDQSKGGNVYRLVGATWIYGLIGERAEGGLAGTERESIVIR